MNFLDIFVFIIAFISNLPNYINTVDNLDLPKYMGNWNQVYTNRITNMILGQNTSCVNTNFNLIDDDTKDDNFIMTFNYNYNNSYYSTNALAYTPDDNFSGQLITNFYNKEFSLSYFILQNGPIINDKYQYSIVTDEMGIMLIVLVRNLSNFVMYQNEIDSVIEHYNFTDYYRQPLLVNHYNC